MSYRRVPSHNNGDQSVLNPNDSSFMNHNNTTRSISSSSASMISTPSNNIRKLQLQNLQTQQLQQQSPHHQQHEVSTEAHSSQHDTKNKLRTTTNLITKGKSQYLKPKKSANVNLVKNKLLNLQKSSRIYTKNKSEQTDDESKAATNKKVFVLRKPVNMNSYDYSIFRDYPDGEKYDDGLPPAVKESQIKAWESAEKITNNLIFENDSDLSDDDDYGINEGETNDSISVDNKRPLGASISNFSNNDPPEIGISHLIKSIPGYTKGELDIVGKRFANLQRLGQLDEFSPKLYEDEEKKLLWNFRQDQQSNQGKVFNQYQSLTGKRKIQVLQKKEILNKIFGYNNVLNLEYITNNTSYSSLDNAMNISKAFQEDKEETNQLLLEDKEFQLSLEETRTNLEYMKNHSFADLDAHISLKKNKKFADEFDNEKYHQLIAAKLTKAYYKRHNGTTNDDASNDDFNNFALSYLRRCIRNDDDNDDD